MDTSDLAKRMKDYESIPKIKLMKRCPVICRIDGKAHHSFCKKFVKPFDEVYMKSMQETAKYLCENLQGVVMSYQQSDEITLVFVDYKELNTSPYFDYEVQKLCSIIASMATMKFNKVFLDNADEIYDKEFFELGLNNMDNFDSDEEWKDLADKLDEKYDVYYKAIKKGAMFDARCFNIPKEEVTNMIYWRQLDATRNSIQMVGQANFSHKELQNKSCNQIQDMLFTKKGINWNDLPTYQKRGSCCVKTDRTITCASDEDGEVKTCTAERPHWIIDKEIPIFKNEGRQYIEKLINVGELN